MSEDDEWAENPRRIELQSRMNAAGFDWWSWGKGRGYMVRHWNHREGYCQHIWSDGDMAKVIDRFVERGEGTAEDVVSYFVQRAEREGTG